MAEGAGQDAEDRAASRSRGRAEAGHHRPMLPAASGAAWEPRKRAQTEGRCTMHLWGDQEDHCMGNAAAARSGMAQRSSNKNGLKQLKASLLRCFTLLVGSLFEWCLLPSREPCDNRTLHLFLCCLLHLQPVAAGSLASGISSQMTARTPPFWPLPFGVPPAQDPASCHWHTLPAGNRPPRSALPACYQQCLGLLGHFCPSFSQTPFFQAKDQLW